MRLIFSTILAAVLVFGGTLLFAHYFGSIEVRNEPAGTDNSRSQDDRTVWHCPEVAELLAGSIPEGFSGGTAERDRPDERGDWPNDDFVWPDESFAWTSAELWGTFSDGGGAGGNLYCNYIGTGQNKDGLEWFSLTLAPGLLAELHLASAWKRGDYHYGVFLRCDEAIADCGFYVVDSDG